MRRRSRPAAGAAVLAVAAAVVLLGACSSSSASSAPPATATRPATTARLRILAPRPGAVVGARPTLRLQLTGARLANAAAGGNVPADQGFVHVYVDDKLVSVLYSLTQKLPTLDPGPHTVRVELVAVDHAPFANQVTDTSRFRVKA